MTTPGDNLAVGYGRISQEDKRSPKLSPDIQAESIKAFAAQHHINLADVFIDRGVSGGKLLRDRPAGKLALDAIAKGAKTLLCFRVDRVFRRVDDAAHLLRKWEKAGVRLVSVTEGIDTSAENGWEAAILRVFFAEMER